MKKKKRRRYIERDEYRWLSHGQTITGRVNHKLATRVSRARRLIADHRLERANLEAEAERV